METLVAVIHIVTAFVLILLILLQDSKSGSLGGAFGGGGSNSVLGATGATTLAQKMTRGAAVIFAVTSILLTVYSSRGNRSVLDSLGASAPAATAPAPAAPPADSAPAATSAPAEAPAK